MLPSLCFCCSPVVEVFFSIPVVVVICSTSVARVKVEELVQLYSLLFVSITSSSISLQFKEMVKDLAKPASFDANDDLYYRRWLIGQCCIPKDFFKTHSSVYISTVNQFCVSYCTVSYICKVLFGCETIQTGDLVLFSPVLQLESGTVRKLKL